MDVEVGLLRLCLRWLGCFFVVSSSEQQINLVPVQGPNAMVQGVRAHYVEMVSTIA